MTFDVVEYTARGRTESTSDAIAMARGLLTAEPAPDSYFYVANLRYVLALLVQDVERGAAIEPHATRRAPA